MAAPVRSFEPLHAERIYLLGSLKQQKHDAAALLRKIAPLEKSLHEDRLPHVQKKTRKQLGWLKCRLGRATQQEQSILARLDYLNYEIQVGGIDDDGAQELLTKNVNSPKKDGSRSSMSGVSRKCVNKNSSSTTSKGFAMACNKCRECK